jgi:hypothetical protein
MSKVKQWGEARQLRREAEEYISLIGKTTKRSTVAIREGENATAGSLTKLVVTTQMHFQPYDGATNYHNCKAFDEALSTVARKHWGALHAEALELLRQQEREAAIAAKSEVDQQMRDIEAAMSEQV